MKFKNTVNKRFLPVVFLSGLILGWSPWDLLAANESQHCAGFSAKPARAMSVLAERAQFSVRAASKESVLLMPTEDAPVQIVQLSSRMLPQIITRGRFKSLDEKNSIQRSIPMDGRRAEDVLNELWYEELATELSVLVDSAEEIHDKSKFGTGRGLSTEDLQEILSVIQTINKSRGGFWLYFRLSSEIPGELQIPRQLVKENSNRLAQDAYSEMRRRWNSPAQQDLAAQIQEESEHLAEFLLAVNMIDASALTYVSELEDGESFASWKARRLKEFDLEKKWDRLVRLMRSVSLGRDPNPSNEMESAKFLIERLYGERALLQDARWRADRRDPLAARVIELAREKVSSAYLVVRTSRSLDENLLVRLANLETILATHPEPAD